MTARAVFVAGLLALPAGLAAQAGPTPPPAPAGDTVLALALRLATEGQGDSARALVRAKLRATRTTDSTFAAALFTAGVIADHLDTARTYFRRVSIEYASSSWADDALVRLAQIAFAAGDYAAASRTAQRVLLDYPLSDRHDEAAFWAARAELETGNLRAACGYLQTAAAAARDVELSSRVQYYAQRCRTLASDTARPDTAAGPAGVGAVTFAVQVAAVSSVAAADEQMRALHAQGYESRVLRDADGLWKVRVGRFTQRADAQRLAAELREKLGGQPFVVEER